MRIEVWADTVCPWAYIGKRRLERALADPALAGLDTQVVWRPYRIDPTAPAQAVPAEDTAAPGHPVQIAAEEEGLGPGWGAAWRASSHDAHRLAALAYEHGGSSLQCDVVERVMKAHFLEGADISDQQLLQAIADTAGLPSNPAPLELDAAEHAVRELLLIGKARGIATSPTLVVGDRALAGAQPPEAIIDFLTAAADVHTRETPEEVLRLRWAESLLRQRDPLGALTFLRPLLDRHGDDPNVRGLAARAYFHSAQLSRAHDVLRQLVADTPDDSYARLMLGRTLQRLGREQEAAVHLKTAAAMTPEFG
ncbi:DsbA family protein [Streptomyces ferrugineus]|uniref:DsbA family protein n=1 Tax=Streptomyces ferrugineus TaxID=1413221 RepID=A0A7M2SF99_9ACTN|nr:DsbA family protein [Streptomyces ferrugineus]QOV34996.1 DsbA family protein [Streptomyces ferrugineus]